MLRIAVLGPLEASRGGQAVDVGSLKLRSVLGLLAMQPNNRVARDEIIDALWGDRPPGTSVNLVHTYIARLRKVVEADGTVRISSTRAGYQLIMPAEQLDLLRFDILAFRARHSDDLSLYEKALRCWRGPFLADLPARLREQPAAVAVSARRLGAALGYADLALALDRGHEDVVRQLRVLALTEPLHEGLHARLMLVLAAAGQHTAALRVFAEISGRLTEELGLSPGAELAAAHQRIAFATHEHVPALLPADVPGFAGRQDYLDQLDVVAGKAGTAGNTAVVISAIAGTAGVGKTALAVRWARRAKDRYPGGQLYVNLRGYAPGPPVPPVAALTRFLHALGVPAEDVPVDEDEAASQYRTLLADRTALILLDNAASTDQVRPLLPGNPDCLVLITSRDRLTGLTATEGAHRIALEVLAPADAARLISNVIGADRAQAEPAAVAALAETCGYLPLALRIAAANLTSAPTASIAGYLTELRERGRLDGAVLAAFDHSYTSLEPAARRLFRLLGLVPGPDFTPAAAAALCECSFDDGRRLLETLAAAHLVHQHVAGRYQFHDLLREYASMLVSESETQPATRRLFDFYLFHADAADRLLYPHFTRLPVPRHSVVFTEKTAAVAWLEAERVNLGAAVINAPDHYAWQLADSLHGYFLSRGHLRGGLVMCDAALNAARQQGNEMAEAAMLDIIGLMNFDLSDFPQAAGWHTKALELHRKAGDKAAEASSLCNLGRVYSNLGHSATSIRCHEEALELHRLTGNRRGEAIAVNFLGAVHRNIGHMPEALAYGTTALEICRQLGDRDAESRVLHSLGLTNWVLGRLAAAAGSFQSSIELLRAVGNLSGEVVTLAFLAQTSCDAGRYREAEEQALLGIEKSRRIGDHRARARCLVVFAAIQQHLGRHQAAEDRYQEAIQLAHHTRFVHDGTSVLLGLASLYRATGRLAEAQAHSQYALTVARDTDAVARFEGPALTELAHVYLALRDLEQAAHHAVQALDVVRKRQQRLSEARALYVLGLVRQAMGDNAAAQVLLRAALEIFHDIGTPEAEEVGALLNGAR